MELYVIISIVTLDITLVTKSHDPLSTVLVIIKGSLWGCRASRHGLLPRVIQGWGGKVSRLQSHTVNRSELKHMVFL